MSEEKKSEQMLFLGTNPHTTEMVYLPSKALNKHIAVFGQSGSGKTVACKILIEEAIRSRIPGIIIDPQGDICSLAVMEDWEKLEKYGLDKEFYEQYKDNIEVTIFTPASEKGIPLSINPLILPPSELDKEEKILALDGIATSLANVLGYRLNTEKGKGVKAYLISLLEALMEQNILVQDFDMLIKLINTDESFLSESMRNLMNEREKQSLVKNIQFLTVGANSLVFTLGPKLEIPTLIKPSNPEKIRLSIVYLNTLNSQKMKELYISTLSQSLYSYILSNPSTTTQLIFYIDELTGLIPPHPRNPPTKEWLKLLFKQGRKYGLSMLVATQNVSDVDYKAFGQVSTFLFGRFMAAQDLKIVNNMVQSHPNTRFIADSLPKLNPGQFYLLSPDNYPEPLLFQTRRLYSSHYTLNDNDISKLYLDPPETLSRVAGDYDRSVDVIDHKKIEEELNLSDIEADMKKIKDFDSIPSTLDKSVDIEKIDSGETADSGLDFNIDDEFPDVEFGVDDDESELGVSEVVSPTIFPEDVKSIDLSKVIKSMKDHYLKYETIDFKNFIEKAFKDHNYSYLGTNQLRLAYIPFMYLDFNIIAKRTIDVIYANQTAQEEITMELPIKRLFPLVDKIKFENSEKIWKLDSLPFLPEEVFAEFISVLPLQNLGSLFSPSSSNIRKIALQKHPKNLLESFHDVLLNDLTFYSYEWQNTIEDSLLQIEEKNTKIINEWVKETERKKVELFTGVQSKREKVKQFQAKIERAKAIYSSLKPIIDNKYKRSQKDIVEFNKAVETIKYGPEVVQKFVKDIENSIEKIKQLDDRVKATPKVKLVRNIKEIISAREYSLPKVEEIKDIYVSIINIPVSIAELTLVDEKGNKKNFKVIAESALGSSLALLCDICYDNESDTMNFENEPSICSVCGKMLCNDHSLNCANTQQVICPEHAQICSSCKKIVSSATVEKCSVCETILCSEDIVRCSVCEKIICEKHLTKKEKRGIFKSEMLSLCPEHAKRK